MALIKEFLPDFDGKVAVFVREVISQNQDEWFGWVEVSRFLTFGFGGDVIESQRDCLDSLGIKSWSFLVKTFGNIFANGGDPINAEGDLALHGSVGGPSFRRCMVFRDVVRD